MQRFYWYGMKNYVRMYVKQCETCAAIKNAPLGIFKSGASGDLVATYYIGPLPVTPRGNRYILVLTDDFSKYDEILAVPTRLQRHVQQES